MEALEVEENSVQSNYAGEKVDGLALAVVPLSNSSAQSQGCLEGGIDKEIVRGEECVSDDEDDYLEADDWLLLN